MAKKTVEEIYTGKTLHEHILSASDTYIGSTKSDPKKMFVFDESNEKIIEETINYVPGLFKIFDEILVNARDQTVRDKTCKNININIDKTTGEISVSNDGVSIPIEMHNTYKIYVPEFIFSRLLSSQNYDTKGKQVGGKNGYGAKLANIYSKKFIVHIIGVDSSNKKLEYKQEFRNNMYDIGKPEINKVVGKVSTMTKISFIPDYERFEMKGLSNDMYSLMIKRCYDVAACTDKSVSININGEKIKCKDFQDYINLYQKDNIEEIVESSDNDSEDKVPKNVSSKTVYEKINSRWEVGITFNVNSGDKYISFVNGISTFNGGTHMKHVVDLVINKIIEYINAKKNYKSLKISPATIKQYLTFFVNCIIEDPGFDSQTKETMNSRISDWCTCGNSCVDVKCEINDAFIKKLCDGKNGLVDEVVSISAFKESRELVKSDGKKVSSLRDIEKLNDAKFAGTKNSHLASIILCEGDSANGFVNSGISVIGSERYGSFPLKGKVINPRNSTINKLKNNKELINIKKILGLQQGVKYEDVSKLRYGSIIILTDQDTDGSHIKGLLINMFELFWPELLKIKGFIKCYNTPIVKAWKISNPKIIKNFYSIPEYEKWNETDGGSTWGHKYYKGLGTSTPLEAKESFKMFDDNLVQFEWTGNNQDNDIDDNNNLSHLAIVKAFDKKKADDRKIWLKQFDKTKMIEYKPKMTMTYTDFIDKELIVFSNDNNIRAIPSLIDGLKPSTRMIMFSMFKRGRNAKKEVKVAQLAGYVSENTAYHHGEVSLQETIVGLAQNYTGSNNINMLQPIGIFGFRRHGGNEHAQARYIYTKLDPITPYIFREEDDDVLIYNYDDDRKVEPENYAPIIPMVLINGSRGIGTGFSTNIPPHNPVDVIENLKRMLNGKTILEMSPWYNGFLGTITKNIDSKKTSYTINGKYEINGNKVHITEIPIVDNNIHDYETMIDKKVCLTKDDNLKILDFDKPPNNNKIDMTITFKGNELQKLYKDGSLEKFLGLTQNLTVSNLHVFDRNGKIIKCNSTNEILEKYFEYRLELYGIRKEYYLRKLKNDLDIAKYKVKFIKEVNAKTIVLANKDTKEVSILLKEKSYPVLSTNINKDINNDDDDDELNTLSYKYLLDMQMKSMTKDNIAKLENTMEKCQILYDEYDKMTPKDIWNKELDELLIAYDDWLKRWIKEENLINGVNELEPVKSVKKKRVVKQ